MPLSKEDRDKLCCEIINTFLFDKVWNEPFSEFRVNIKPLLLKNGSVVGSFGVRDANIKLPTAGESYYVWAISIEDFNVGLQLPTATWVDTATICNDWNTMINMYGISGAMFSKGAVYFRYNQSRSVIFIAAKKDMVTKCIPANSIDNVYLTVYFDSDVLNKMHALSIKVETTRLETQYQSQIDTFMGKLKKPEWLQVYRNGVEITDPNSTPVLRTGEYLDFIIDENILFSFDIDITSTGENPVFLSKRDKTWKQLLHIPKALNPDNKVVTHNTCDFFIRRRFSSETYGYYLHRAAGQRSVNQVTHQDMAVPLFVLDAYRDYLQEQEITIHGVVRIHDKDNVLIRDASYIDLLYSDVHDDDRIIEILCGKGPEEIPWWRADELEDSAYINMMFDTPNLATIDHMKEYVEALGFYQVVNLLCHRVVDTIITDGFSGSLTFNLPVLYIGMQVIPIVYLNKRALRKEYVTFKNNGDNTITIGIDDSIVTKPGDELVVIFFVDGDNSIFEFTPMGSNLSITVPYDDVSVYMKQVAPDAFPLQGINATSETSYVHLEKNTNYFVTQKHPNGGTTITFNYEYEGTPFVIQSAYCSYYQSFDLTPYTSVGKTLALPIQGKISDSTDVCPILNFKNVSVYLNGKYLVRGIDYFINTITDKNGNTSFSELVVQTMDHFEEGIQDRLDVLFNVAEIEDISSGFSIDDELRDETPVNLYFPNISASHVSGYLERYVVYKGVYIELPSDLYQQGSIFEIQTSVPKLVKDFILEHVNNEDIERIRILNEYFYDLHQIVPDVLVLEGKHRIYSVFMNNFIYDAIQGNIALVDEPDVNRMRDQIKPYLYLQEMDLCFKGLDQRFIDYYPQYVNYEVPPATKRIIDRFIEEFMPKNEDPTVEVVYEQ